MSENQFLNGRREGRPIIGHREHSAHQRLKVEATLQLPVNQSISVSSPS